MENDELRALLVGNLAARCKEILDWQNTGVLKGNALRSLSAKMPGKERALTLAERKTAEEAMTVVVKITAALAEKDG